MPLVAGAPELAPVAVAGAALLETGRSGWRALKHGRPSRYPPPPRSRPAWW